jgi:hypothetical protein
MLELARQAAHRLAYEHRVCRVAAPTRLAPSEPGETLPPAGARRLLAQEGARGWAQKLSLMQQKLWV